MIRRRFAIAASVAACLLAVIAAPGSLRAALVGEGRHKELQAARTSRAPDIDGKLDDAVWERATPDSSFTQQFPIDGADPTVFTEVRVLFDDDNLYVAIRADDPEPERIIRRLVRRDRDIDSDWVEVVLDSRHDHDSGFVFRINAAGVLTDDQLHDDTRRNRAWDAVWRARAHRTASGWSAELAIPFSVLRYNTGKVQTWGFNLIRYVARTKETLQWVHVPQNQPGNASRAGHLVGLGELGPPRTLELRPFVVGRLATLLPSGGGLGVGQEATVDPSVSAGADLKVGLTSNLTLDLTMNPDFGQVEVDEIILNLSRFEAFFPEKRPFFLESSDLFATDLQLFYSRRLGAPTSGLGPGDAVAVDGEQLEVIDTPFFVPIWAAGRLTGRLTPKLVLASVAAVTGPETVTATSDLGTRRIDAAPARSYLAARGKYTFFGSSYLGFIATGRTQLTESDTGPREHDAYAESIDGRWVAPDGSYRAYFQVATTHRVGGRRYLQDTMSTSSCTDATCDRLRRIDGTIIGPGDTGFAAELGGGQFGAEHWTLYTRYRFATADFDANDVGFEADWNYHKMFSRLTLREQKPFWKLQNASLVLQGESSFALDGTHRDAYIQLQQSALHSSFWSHVVTISATPLTTYSIRETFDGARTERVRSVGGSASLSTDTRRRLRGSASASLFEGLGDPQRDWGLGANLEVQVIPQVELQVGGGWSVTDDSLRFYACAAADGKPCSPASASRDYTFARLSSDTLSLTGRASWALSPTISLQGYLQVFAARGRWDDYAVLEDLGSGTPTLERGDLVAVTGRGDTDGDGVVDDDFAFSTLNANLVLRWELNPGTFFTAAYTRAQRRDVLLLGRQPTLGIAGLNHGRTEEVGLLKLTLFL